MSSVVADPEKLRQLAKVLKSGSDRIEQTKNEVSRGLSSSGWEDRERQRFEQALNADLKALSQIAKRLDTDYPALLQKKARALDEFRR